MKTIYYYIIILSLFSSCKDGNDNINLYTLIESSNKIEIPIDSDTKIYTRAMHYFEDTTGIEYITIEDSESIYDYNTINFYRLDSCKLSHKVKIEKEGVNGIPRFYGHGICSLDNLFITGFGKNVIYQINRKGEILKKLDYEMSDNKEIATEFDLNSLVNKTLVIEKSKIYGTQFPLKKQIKGADFDKTPLCLTIDTCTGSVQKLPLNYPRLWESGNKMGYNAHCSRAYDGKHFIYAFLTENDIIVTTDHIESKTYSIKSKYIDNIYSEGYPTDISFEEFNKAVNEQAIYGNFIYDKYRNIYYRFAYPKCTVDKYSFEYIFCRKEFSIIIIDSNFKIIGETLFPAGKYASKLFFVNKEGLYLSENNIDNPNTNENMLTFSCLKLKLK